MSAPNLDVREIVRLYEKYSEDLRGVRNQQALLYRAKARSRLEERVKAVLPFTRGSWLWGVLRESQNRYFGTARYMNPAFDDLDCEITYLLIRESRPEVVVEVSPAGGWSTSWLLHGVNDNAFGSVYSYDLRDDATKLLPVTLDRSRWRFTHGDVRQQEKMLPERIDYLFLDSLHTGAFAHWYIENLFPRVPHGGVVGVDDVFPIVNPIAMFVRKSDRNPREGEPEVLLSWLSEHRQAFFTVAPRIAPSAFEALNSLRARLTLGPQIHESTTNPAVFFKV